MKKLCEQSIVFIIIISMLLSSAAPVQTYADSTVTDSFYVLDENGNPELVEIRSSGAVNASEKKQTYTVVAKNEKEVQVLGEFKDSKEALKAYGEAVEKAESAVTYSENDSDTIIEIIDEEDDTVSSTDNIIGIVRFVKDPDDTTLDYEETDTGRKGYLSAFTAAEAAYIGTQEEGVFCYIAGVKMLVDPKDVDEIVSYEDQDISYYYCSDGYLLHKYGYYYYSNDKLVFKNSSNRVGFAPSYLKEGVNYYSYDGHYFYEAFEEMIEDYRSSVYDQAVNVDNPYYNYYQYLSFHTTAPFTGEEYDAYVNAKVDNSKGKDAKSAMRTTGPVFVNAQNKNTINALLMTGIAINESGWGTSSYALTKNNLFGLNAVDANPDDSKAFESVEQCIEEFAYNWLHSGYLNGKDSRYRGPHLGDKHSGINVCYASDPYWGEKAASQAYFFDNTKEDYGRYTIGIAVDGNIKLYKEADPQSKAIYTSEAGPGGNLFDYPVLILGIEDGVDGKEYYKIVSDMSLMEDRSDRNVEALYKPSRDYVYAIKEDIRIVFEGNGNDIIIPDPVDPELPKEGWEEIDGISYYRKADGTYAVGWYEVKGAWYYFDEDGRMQTGWLSLNDKWFYLDDTGAMKTGWLLSKGNWYFFDELGVMKTGWLLSNGIWYYFDYTGCMKTGWLTENDFWYYLDVTGAMKTGWLLYDGNWYYFDAVGVMATDQWIGDSYVDKNGIWDPDKVK